MSYQEEKLQAIADAIRSKKGTTEKIPATSFANEILALPDMGASAKPEIGIIVTPTKEQQVIEPSGNNVFNKVTVEKIPDEYIIPAGTLEITENDTYDVTNYESVEVNVAGSGGGSSDAFIQYINGEQTELPTNDLSGLTTIRDYAFYYAPFTKANIPEGVTKIGTYAFCQNKSLTEITLPTTIRQLGTYIFYQSTGIKRINYNIDHLSYTLSSGNNLFYGSKDVDIYIGDNVTIIPERIFSSADNVNYNIAINSVNFSSNSQCTSIGQYAFAYGKGKLSINLPDTITSMGNYVFFQRTEMQSFKCPTGITQIPASCCGGCSALTEVILHDNITRIGNGSFLGCKALPSITMPSGLTKIDQSAFTSCTSLLKYDFTKCTQIPTLASTNAFNSINADCKMYVPDALYDEWIIATNWSNFASYIVKASEMPTE